MRSYLSTLFAPADDVVAIHESADAVDAAVYFLGCAGYPGRMLEVIGRLGPTRPAASAANRRWHARWATSGVFWGTVWAMIALVDAMLLARNPLPFGMILMGGALILAIQTAFVQSSVAPERSTQASWHGASQSNHAYGRELAADKLLLVVRGTRSEIALARSLLAMRQAGAAAATA
jgi:hypothetical protein